MFFERLERRSDPLLAAAIHHVLPKTIHLNEGGWRRGAMDEVADDPKLSSVESRMPEHAAADVGRRETIGSKGISRRVIAVAVAVIVVIASGIFVWAEYFGPRSMSDLAKLVVDDPGPGSPGFKHSLAGDKMTLKGKVTNITTRSTTLGNLSFVELDHFDLLHLVVWGDVPYDIGDRVSSQIRFEWSVCNDEIHVYSPQLDFPSLATLPAVGIVLQSVAAVGGTVVMMDDGATDPLALTVFDQYPELSLAGINLSLRVGRSSFAAEYVDVLGIGSDDHSYGHEIDSITDLATGTAENGTVSFTDVNHDGLLGRNDTFTLRNLSRPSQQSGVYTYVIILQLNDPPRGRTVNNLAVTYLVMTNRGALSYLSYDAPYVRAEADVISQTEVKFTFARAMSEIRWDDVKLGLRDDNNWDYWYTASGDLDDGPMSREDLPSITVGPINAVCSVFDLAGNGLLDEGDYVTVSTWGGTEFSTSTNYTFTVTYIPMGSHMTFCEFHP
jgi:hypothetical protein